MRIAILSDIHDRIELLSMILRSLDASVEAILCCGDLCSPFVMKMMIDLTAEFQPGIHVVFGNNDADQFRITRIAMEHTRVQLHGELAQIELAGKKIALNHFDYLGRELAATVHYDLVCYGHNHQWEQTRMEVSGRDVLSLNPGSLIPMKIEEGKIVEVEPSFMIYNSESHSAERFVYEVATSLILKN